MSKKKENLKDMDMADLNKKLTELRENLRVLKFKVEGSKPKNVKETNSFKKQIARILTEINSKK